MPILGSRVLAIPDFGFSYGKSVLVLSNINCKVCPGCYTFGNAIKVRILVLVPLLGSEGFGAAKPQSINLTLRFLGSGQCSGSWVCAGVYGSYPSTRHLEA